MSTATHRRKVEFDTTDYEIAHGRKPRGYGAWAFSPERRIDPCDPSIIWVYNATYTEAKKIAAEPGTRVLP